MRTLAKHKSYLTFGYVGTEKVTVLQRECEGKLKKLAHVLDANTQQYDNMT